MRTVSSTPIRLLPVNAVLQDDLAQDPTPELKNYGLFALTLGPMTRGSSRSGTLQLTSVGQWFGVKEEAKTMWEGVSAGLSGFAHTSFQEKFEEIKMELRIDGFPVDDCRLLFNHCIIGLPRGEREMEILFEGLQDNLWEAKQCMSYHTHGRTRLGCEQANLYPFVRMDSTNQM